MLAGESLFFKSNNTSFLAFNRSLHICSASATCCCKLLIFLSISLIAVSLSLICSFNTAFAFCSALFSALLMAKSIESTTKTAKRNSIIYLLNADMLIILPVCWVQQLHCLLFLLLLLALLQLPVFFLLLFLL